MACDFPTRPFSHQFNAWQQHERANRKSREWRLRRAYLWITALVSGVLAGCLAFALNYLTEGLNLLKYRAALKYIKPEGNSAPLITPRLHLATGKHLFTQPEANPRAPRCPPCPQQPPAPLPSVCLPLSIQKPLAHSEPISAPPLAVILILTAHTSIPCFAAAQPQSVRAAPPTGCCQGRLTHVVLPALTVTVHPPPSKHSQAASSFPGLPPWRWPPRTYMRSCRGPCCCLRAPLCAKQGLR